MIALRSIAARSIVLWALFGLASRSSTVSAHVSYNDQAVHQHIARQAYVIWPYQGGAGDPAIRSEFAFYLDNGPSPGNGDNDPFGVVSAMTSSREHKKRISIT